jgi:hypothetical protein
MKLFTASRFPSPPQKNISFSPMKRQAFSLRSMVIERGRGWVASCCTLSLFHHTPCPPQKEGETPLTTRSYGTVPGCTVWYGTGLSPPPSLRQHACDIDIDIDIILRVTHSLTSNLISFSSRLRCSRFFDDTYRYPPRVDPISSRGEMDYIYIYIVMK